LDWRGQLGAGSAGQDGEDGQQALHASSISDRLAPSLTLTAKRTMPQWHDPVNNWLDMLNSLAGKA
jgi:hypothetical protein